MKRETLDLTKLEDAIKSKDDIQLTKDDSINATKLTIIKRDGRKEPYNINKIRKVVSWATEHNDVFTNELLKDTEIKLYEEIKITDLYDELIKTSANKISLLYPQWEYITAKLYLLKYYKNTWNVGKDFYPDFQEYLNKGIQHHVLDKNIVQAYSKDDIAQIGDMIVRERDYIFNWKALLTFTEKYCLKYTKTKKLELPQHAYMRMAMALHVNEKDRLSKIKETYDNISTHKYSLATPIAINALTPNQNLSSCVLSKTDDDSHSIMDSAKNIAIYSKNKGGTAIDVSELRASGSHIKSGAGSSSGPVPFIKVYESVISAWNQGGVRAGSCAVYFQWWHLDVFDLLALKSNGGTDDNRARKLVYSCKINNLFLNRVVNDEDITLFDPNDVQGLHNLTGDDFNEMYEYYEQKANIRKRTVKAREIWVEIMKQRVEHGNLYIFHEENVNDSSMLNRYINSSNLCLSGDTIVNLSVDGEENIETTLKNVGLYMKEYDTVKILSSTEKIYSDISAFAKTAENAEVMKITDEDTGQYIICTPDHKIYTKNRGYVMAKELTESDELQVIK